MKSFNVAALSFWVGVTVATVANVIGSYLNIQFSYVPDILVVGAVSTVAVISANGYIAAFNKQEQLSRDRIRCKQVASEKKKEQAQQKGSYAIP